MKTTKAKRVPLVSVRPYRGVVGGRCLYYNIVVGGVMIVETFTVDKWWHSSRYAGRLRAAIRKAMKTRGGGK